MNGLEPSVGQGLVLAATEQRLATKPGPATQPHTANRSRAVTKPLTRRQPGSGRSGRNSGSRRRILKVLAPFLLLVTLLAFRQQLLTGLGESLVVSDTLEHADLIYVLAGDFWGSRVLLGANLGAKGWAPQVILSGGPYQGSCACDLSVDFAVQHGYPRSLFMPLPMEAHSTVEEAHVMGPIFQRLGARRIILVTSNFHSRRAAEVFRLFLPEFDFKIEASPERDFDPRTWWKTPQQSRLFWSEYRKIAGTLLMRFHLASADSLRQGRL